MSLIILDVCLSDIPKEDMKQGSNGKWYAKICCADRREPDQYGNTHSLYMSQTQEQRAANAQRKYVGSAKAAGGQQQAVQPQQGYQPAPQGYAPQPGYAPVPQQGYAPAPQPVPVPQQGYAPAPPAQPQAPNLPKSLPF